jgi:prophage DNA circulation protein
MSWRDELQPASIRGVPFLVETGSMKFGRRAFAKEYPYRNDPFVDDMGRRMRVYTLEAFLIEAKDDDDLFGQRDALIEALEKEGPATLIHPRFGALRVQVGDATWRTEKREGNVERFSIDLLEATAEAQPQVAVDTLDVVTVAADALDDAQGGMLDRLMAIKNQATHVIGAAQDTINKGMQGVKKLVRIGTGAADAVAGLSQAIDSAVSDISSLILLPRKLASAVSGLVHQVLGIDDRIETALSGYRAIESLWGDVEPIPQTTPSRAAQANNQVAIIQLFKTAAVVAAVRVVVNQASTIAIRSNTDSPFASADQAYAVRDELVKALDDIALTADADMYIAIVELQSALVAHIEAHGNALPRVTKRTFPDSMPMLVIAHRIDGTIDRLDDLVSRNRIKHPLFVPAGRELEVLNG